MNHGRIVWWKISGWWWSRRQCYRAGCTCGWEGIGWYGDEDSAELEAEYVGHVGEALRQAGSVHTERTED